jgi:hypothetical protein
LTAPRLIANPQYGSEAEAESGAFEEYYDDEDEEEEALQDAIAAIEDGAYVDECVCLSSGSCLVPRGGSRSWELREKPNADRLHSSLSFTWSIHTVCHETTTPISTYPA